MSHQHPTTGSLLNTSPDKSSRPIPRPASAGEFIPSINRQPPPTDQALALSTIIEASNKLDNQRFTKEKKSGIHAGTVTRNPEITLTEASTPTMKTESGEEKGKERGSQPAPSNRPTTAAGPADRRPPTRQKQALSRYELSRYPTEHAIARPSLQHASTSESMRRKEASYYVENTQPDIAREQGSYYGAGPTEIQQPGPLAETQITQSLVRSRRYSPRRAPPPPLSPSILNSPRSRSKSRSPPLSERLTVFHKPVSVVPIQKPAGGRACPEALSTRDADSICDDLVRKVKIVQLGKMYDRVVEADRRGLVDDELYDMVLDFFYRFLPMVFANGESDPIIINRRQILDHQRVWQIFGPRGEGLSRKARGKNRPHPWYTRPKDKKMSFKEVAGEVLDSLPRVHIVPGPAKRKKDEGQGQR